MGLFRSIFNGTVGTVVRTPVALVKVFDDLMEDGLSARDVGDLIDYLTTGESEDPDYDGIADFGKRDSE